MTEDASLSPKTHEALGEFQVCLTCPGSYLCNIYLTLNLEMAWKAQRDYHWIFKLSIKTLIQLVP